MQAWDACNAGSAEAFTQKHLSPNSGEDAAASEAGPAVLTPLSKGADATQSRGGIFLPLHLQCALRAEYVQGISTGTSPIFRQGFAKAGRSARLMKIPPLACGLNYVNEGPL